MTNKLPPAERSGHRDFDFEFGAWQVHIKRLQHPLTSSSGWLEYEGISVVGPVWDGRANLGQLTVGGPAGHIEGLSLRLFNPESNQWNIFWANSKDGVLGQAMIGEFKNGQGEFYNQESPTAGRSMFDLSSQTSLQARSDWSRPSRTTEARLGKRTGSAAFTR